MQMLLQGSHAADLRAERLCGGWGQWWKWWWWLRVAHGFCEPKERVEMSQGAQTGWLKAAVAVFMR